MKQLALRSARIVCVAAVTTLAVMTVACAQPALMAMPMVTASQSDADQGTMGANGVKKSMMTGMEGMQKMVMTGDTDKDFAMTMQIHHQQGVDMDRMEIVHGISTAVKKMTKQIVTAC